MSTVQLPAVAFPDSDGKPMAENTRQYEAIVTLKGNIEAFAPATAFVAGDHLIYTDPHDSTVCQAPDVYIAFDRPRGHRGSYKVWEEGGVFPQVIFEVLGPSNTAREMHAKRRFYFGHGSEEYYEFDPEAGTWFGFVVDPDKGLPVEVESMDDHISPRLGMRFGFRPLELLVYRPDGSVFESFQEIHDRAADETERADAERERADAERERADAEQERADAERERADAERARANDASREADRLRTLLKTAGLDPDAAPS